MLKGFCNTIRLNHQHQCIQVKTLLLQGDIGKHSDRELEQRFARDKATDRCAKCAVQGNVCQGPAFNLRSFKGPFALSRAS